MHRIRWSSRYCGRRSLTCSLRWTQDGLQPPADTLSEGILRPGSTPGLGIDKFRISVTGGVNGQRDLPTGGQQISPTVRRALPGFQ